jgi:hypothetical protein
MKNKDLADNYDYEGIFYINKDGVRCRSILDIKHQTRAGLGPDLMVVMMNPGGSYPVMVADENAKKFVRTEPDNTQRQIVRLMESRGYTYARVLNLSDIREKHSQELYRKLKDINFKHSIFDPSRRECLEKYFIHNVPIVVAWGVKPMLKQLIALAVNFLPKHLIGRCKKGNYYYHPLPLRPQKDITPEKWLEIVSAHLPRKQKNPN